VSEGIIIALCSGIAALTAWVFKVLLRIERRQTRLETIIRIRILRDKPSSSETEMLEKED
jgi:hypothetical protein